jgi:N-acyl-phosphatidylethanolamine-hydrolysing phospholipase D
MKRFIIVIILLTPLIFSGCFGFRILTRSLGDTFSTPEKVENKVKHPIKENVKLSALWIGHSSILVQIYDKVILLDPVFTERLGGLLMRKKEPGLDLKDLPRLDLVFVSHSHMDHLSYGSLEMIADMFPGCTLVFPTGDENYLPNFNLNLFRIKIPDYGQGNIIGKTVVIDSVKITPVYALHTGGRYIIDTYVWKSPGATGYIIQYKDICIYFAGDTGYNDRAFKKIGDNFKINLAFIPIGPCRNCDSTGMLYHASSLEALEIFTDVRADYMIPIHYGSYRYFRDADYPKEILDAILKDSLSEYHSDIDRVKILKIGEQLIFDKLIEF